MDMTSASWRKSSYSGNGGPECVEVATLGGASWRKSSYSGNGGVTCVEVARNLPGVVAVRDSTNPHGAHLTFTPADWQAFTTTIKTSAPAR